MKHTYILFTLSLLFIFSTVIAETFKIVIPEIPDIDVSAGESIPIPTEKTAVAFQFEDGRIVVGPKNKSLWSHDGGHTWEEGLEGPGEKVAIDLDGGEILSISRNSKLRPDGKFNLKQRRSLDNWKTITTERPE